MAWDFPKSLHLWAQTCPCSHSFTLTSLTTFHLSSPSADKYLYTFSPHWWYQEIQRWTFGGVCLLAVVNGAAMNMCVHVCVWAPVFSSFGHRSGLAGSYSNSSRICWGTVKLVSMAPAPCSIPISNVWGAFASPLLGQLLLFFVDYKYLVDVKWGLTVGFLTELIEMTLVCKTIQNSSTWFNKTSPVHCIMCPSPQSGAAR